VLALPRINKKQGRHCALGNILGTNRASLTAAMMLLGVSASCAHGNDIACGRDDRPNRGPVGNPYGLAGDGWGRE
jgi:hypothetical protein